SWWSSRPWAGCLAWTWRASFYRWLAGRERRSTSTESARNVADKPFGFSNRRDRPCLGRAGCWYSSRHGPVAGCPDTWHGVSEPWGESRQWRATIAARRCGGLLHESVTFCGFRSEASNRAAGERATAHGLRRIGHGRNPLPTLVAPEPFLQRFDVGRVPALLRSATDSGRVRSCADHAPLRAPRQLCPRLRNGSRKKRHFRAIARHIVMLQSLLATAETRLQVRIRRARHPGNRAMTR